MNRTLKTLRARRWIHAVLAGTLFLGLCASPVGADPEITPDLLQAPSAVSPPTPDASDNGKRYLKLDYAGAFPGLHIVLPPPSGEEKQSMVQPDSKPVVIGFHRDLPDGFKDDLSPELDWVEQADGSFVASLLVTSPEAGSLRVGIRAELTPGGEIRFFGEQSDERFAVVTQEDFPVVDDEIQTLWSPTVDGDTIGIEVTLPPEKAVDAFWLSVDAVAHSPHSMGSLDTAPKLDCPNIHIDVQCRASSTHSNLEDAVAQIRFEEDGSSYACSGTLMNNTQLNFIPYFLTVNHCVSTASVGRTVEAWWFYQRAQCGGSIRDSRWSRTTSGADLLATSAASDLTLLRFRGSLPGGLTYSGWDANLIAHPASVYGIHHPGGDLKKYSAGVTTGNTLSYGVVNAIGVRWSEGTTEGGSVGSGLFLRDGGYLVGGLSHGPACAHNITDYYGPFRDFYFQISHWLAPAGVVLPLVMAASNLRQQGFVRIINHSDHAGAVSIHAIDDSGRRFGPVSLSLRATAYKTTVPSIPYRGSCRSGQPGCASF